MTGRLIVLNKDEDTLSVVNLDTNQVEKVVKTDHNPHEIVITPDGRKSYIACSHGNTVDVMDNNTYEIVKRIKHPDFHFPHGVAVTKDGKKLFVASTYSEKIFILYTETDEIENVIPTHQSLSHMVSFSHDGLTAYIPNIGSGNMTVMNVEKEEIITHFPVGRGPEGAAVHPAGEHLYVANQEDDTISIIDTRTYKEVKKLGSYHVGRCPVRLVFTPDGKYALVANRHSNDLSVIETAQKINGITRPWEIKRIPVGIWAGGIAVNHEGTFAYVANNKTNDVSIINLKTLKEDGRIDVGIHPDGIAFLDN